MSVAAAALVLVLAADSPRARANALFQQGTEAFELGHQETAVLKFGAAYELLPLPEFLFNIALAYRMEGKCAQAAKAYEKYLEAQPAAANRAKVEKRIAQVRACARDEPAIEAEPEVMARPEPNEVPPPIVVEVPVERPLGVRRPAAWALGGAGLVTAGLGFAFYFVASAGYGQLSRSCAPTCSAESVSGPQGQETLGVALLSAGAAAVAAAVVLWVADALLPRAALSADAGSLRAAWVWW
jgi:tetratricopeptide (TPR) repeat protein